MKKFVTLLLATVMCFSLAACGGDGDENNNSGSAGVQVDEGIFNVDITMASTFFVDMTEDEIKAAAKEKGFDKCVVNADGTVTYTMTKSKHEEILNELKASLEETITSMLEGEEAVASFVSIDYADDFSKFDIYVNDQYSDWDNFYVLSFYISGAYYQSFAGVSTDNIDVVVNFIDNETKENLNTASYRDWMSNSEDESGEESASGDTVEITGTPLVVGETITIKDECEFQIDYTNITDDVMPPNPGSWYSHYEADDGKVYVDFCLAYKNLATRDKDADEIINATLIYAGKYQYKGFSMIEEDSRGDFTYSGITNIAPLTTEYLHYLFEIPVEAENSGETIEIEFTISGNTYSYKVR